MGRNICLLLLLIGLFLVGFLSTSHSQVKSVIVEDFTFSRFEKGELVLRLRARNFVQTEEGNFLAKEFEISSPKKGIIIRARSGTYDKKRNLYFFQGEVKLKTERHGDIITNELYYEVKGGILRAPGRVLVRKEGIVVEGSELYYNLATEEFRVKKSVKAKFSL